MFSLSNTQPPHPVVRPVLLVSVAYASKNTEFVTGPVIARIIPTSVTVVCGCNKLDTYCVIKMLSMSSM